MSDKTGGAAADSTAAPPHPRRPRVREVSSRFMSPSIATPITSDLRRSKSAHRRPPSTTTDENLIPQSNRIFDQSSIKHHQQRPDTPIAIATERIVPSRYRQSPNKTHRSSSVTAAAILLHEATSNDSDSCTTASSNQRSSSCPNSPLCASSVPDADKYVSDCARSIGGGVTNTRPPQYPSSCVRSTGLDAKRERKVSSHQEDVHSLKMLSNHYLQWRFANAKAEAWLRARKLESEIKFCSLGSRIADIRDNVKRKHIEFTLLRGVKTLTTIVEAQMPYLDEWSNLEEDYSNSLSGTMNALLSSSVRVPVGAEVRADVGQLREALNSALKVVESIGSHIHKYVQKAEEMDTSISELAKMVGGEKTRVEECAYLLSKTYSSQVKECSLRGTIMQLHYLIHRQPQMSESTV